jgi:urease accessory protein
MSFNCTPRPHQTARRATTTLGLLAAAAVAFAGPAAAHPADEAHVGGSLNGLLHPLLGADHLVAMLAVGVLAALAARRLHVLALPGAFVGGMVVGAGLGLAGIAVGGVETLVAASVVALGLAVMAVRQAPLGWWLVPAVALAGAVHGNAHGIEAPAAALPLAYVAGFVLATAALHAAGALAGVALRRAQLGQLVGGAAVTLFGISLLAG